MRQRMGYIYLLRLDQDTDTAKCVYKIGRTSSLKDRHKLIGILMPYPVTLVWAIYCTDMFIAESDMHARLHTQRLNGEWFRLNPEHIKIFVSITLFQDHPEQQQTEQSQALLDLFVSGELDYDSFYGIANHLAPLLSREAQS